MYIGCLMHFVIQMYSPEDKPPFLMNTAEIKKEKLLIMS